jgi:hypothetical protein
VVPQDHPIRQLKALVDEQLASLNPVFEKLYSAEGRPSIPPERLVKATLLMALYSACSERQLCEQVGINEELPPQEQGAPRFLWAGLPVTMPWTSMVSSEATRPLSR